MKTKQEQIEEMSCFLTMFVKNCDGGCMSLYCYLVGNCAKKLIEAGYGDVSEYKAEIERLKAENNELKIKNWSLEEELKKKELEITYARNNGYEKGYDECEEYMKGKIKHKSIY